MKNYIISENVVQALLVYLSQRPWREVEQIMPALQHLQEAKEIKLPSDVRLDDTTTL